MARIKDITETNDDADVNTSHTGVLPQYEPGDLLLWFVHKDSTTGTSLSLPQGWTQVTRFAKLNEQLVCYKIAQENETAPTTSSSDKDGWGSVMVTLEDAESAEFISKDYLTTNYEPTFQAHDVQDWTPGDMKFVMLSMDSNVGGAYIRNFGRTVTQHLETWSLGMTIQAETYTEGVSTAQNYRVIHSYKRYTSLCEIHVRTKSQAKTDPVVLPYNTDVTLLNRDGAEGTINDETLTVQEIAGTPVIIPNYSKKFNSIQEIDITSGTSYRMASRAIEEEYSMCTVEFDTPKSVGDMMSFHCAPWSSLYRTRLGRNETGGTVIVLIDENGNWSAYLVDSQDAEELTRRTYWTSVLHLDAHKLDSSGELDRTKIQKIQFGFSIHSTTMYVSFANFFNVQAQVIVGGSATEPRGLELLDGYQRGSQTNTSLMQPYYSGTSTRKVQQLLPITIGSETDNRAQGTSTFMNINDWVIEVPGCTVPGTKHRRYNMKPQAMFIEFSLVQGDAVHFQDCLLNSITRIHPIRFGPTNNLGELSFTRCTFRGWSMQFRGNSTYEDCCIRECTQVFFHETVTMRNTIIRDSLPTVNAQDHTENSEVSIIFDTVQNVQNLRIQRNTSKHGIAISEYCTDSIDLREFKLSESSEGTQNPEDLYYNKTSGTLDVYVSADSNIKTWSSAGAEVRIIRDSTSFLINIRNPGLQVQNLEYRIYEVQEFGTLTGSVELQGEESWNADDEIVLRHDGVPKTIAVQILPHNPEDFMETVQYYEIDEFTKKEYVLLKKDLNN